MLAPSVPGAAGSLGPRIKVLDFGIAKLSGELGGRVRTETGVAMGTPAYVAPEQCVNAPCVDGKADVYALGIMLYELVAGRLPFAAEHGFEQLQAHVHAEPVPLAVAQPSVAPELAELVDTMLAKEPARRPSMAEVSQRLDRMPAAGRSRLRAMRARLPWLLATSGAAVILGGVWLAAGSVRDKTRGAVTVPPYREAAPQGPRTVRWVVSSQPSGADVLSADGQLLGSTPWERERPAGPGETVLTLRHRGHESRVLLLSHDTSLTTTLSLVPLPPASGSTAIPDPRPPIRNKANPVPEKPARSRPTSGKADRVKVELMFD